MGSDPELDEDAEQALLALSADAQNYIADVTDLSDDQDETFRRDNPVSKQNPVSKKKNPTRMEYGVFGSYSGMDVKTAWWPKGSKFNDRLTAIFDENNSLMLQAGSSTGQHFWNRFFDKKEALRVGKKYGAEVRTLAYNRNQTWDRTTYYHASESIADFGNVRGKKNPTKKNPDVTDMQNGTCPNCSKQVLVAMGQKSGICGHCGENLTVG